MKRKKIAIVLSLEPQDGGGYQYALLMAECLKKLPESRYMLIAVCLNKVWERWCKEKHIKHIKMNWIGYTKKEIKKNLCFPLYSKIYNMYMTEIGKVIRKEKIDALILTGQLMYIPNLDTKVITPVYDLMHRYEPMFPEVKKGYQERELLFSCQAQYANYILTDSELGKKQFCECYLKKGGRRPHVVSLPFTVSEDILKTDEQYTEVPDKYVFYPAQFWKHKNHLNLIKAIRILKESIHDIHLVLAGSEKNNGREIKKYIINNNLENNITIKGFVSSGNMVYLYKHAVGMIMPSYFGPTNIPPLEAMALGCPVAVSDKYAMPEQVGKAGLLFDPDSPEEIADCIRKLWFDEKLRMEMIRNGYERVRKWGYKEFGTRVHAIVKECLYE